MHKNARGKQVEYVCTTGMGKMLGAYRLIIVLSLDVKYGDVIDHIVSDDLIITT
jgi:hypothetical protein